MKFLRRRLAKGQTARPQSLNRTNTPVTQSTVLATPPRSAMPSKLQMDTERDSSSATASDEELSCDVPVSSTRGEVSQELLPVGMLGTEPSHPLETIAEAECEAASSCGTARTDGGSIRGGMSHVTGVRSDFGHGDSDALPRGEEVKGSHDTSPAYSPRKPTVLISSNSPATHPPHIETAPPYR